MHYIGQISIFLVVFSFSFLESWGQPVRAPKLISEINTDDELIKMLGSSIPSEADKSVVQIFSMREKVIGHLMNLKGNDTIFMGTCLTNPDDYVIDTLNEGTAVTVEVAALYLISAIYYDNLVFATVPYLAGDADIRDSRYNTKKRKKRAWKSVEKWFHELQADGLKELRRRELSPLKFANMQFYGFNPTRKRAPSICLR